MNSNPHNEDESGRKSYRTILRSSGVIGGASLINIVLSLLRMKVIAVLLGPAGVGLIGILQNVMTASSNIGSLGISIAGTRQIAEASGNGDYNGIDVARRALFWGAVVLAIISGLVVWLSRDLIATKILNERSLASTIGWLAVGVSLMIAAGSQQALLTGMRRISDIARISIFSSVLSTVCGLPLVLWLSSDGLIWFVLLGPLGTFLVSHFFVAKLPKFSPKFRSGRGLGSQWKELVKLGLAFMVAGLVGTVGHLVVRSSVQTQLGVDQLGYFQASWIISMTYVGFVLNAMGTDYYPRLTATINNSMEANKLINAQTEVAIMLAGPVLLGMLALAPLVVQLLYSSEFLPAVNVLRWQIFGDVLKLASWPLGFVMLAAGRGKLYVFSESFAVFVFALGTWLLLPYVGVQATGISFALMYILYLPLVFWFARLKTGLRWSKSVKHVFLRLMLSAVAILGLSWWHELTGMLVGICLTLMFGVLSLTRLVKMAELTGPVGKAAGGLRKILDKIGLAHD